MRTHAATFDGQIIINERFFARSLKAPTVAASWQARLTTVHSQKPTIRHKSVGTRSSGCVIRTRDPTFKGSTGETMRISTSILAAAVMLAALSFRARADTSTDDPPTKITGRSVVHYGDLNLSAEEDAKIMLRRIERAAKKACGGHAIVSPYGGTLEHTFEECRERAIDRAVKQLGAPRVTRIYFEARPRES
jgi:UrcA family protein